MKKLIFYISNKNQLLNQKKSELLIELAKQGKGSMLLHGRPTIRDPDNYECLLIARIQEYPQETFVVIFPENYASIAYQMSFADILCSCVLPNRKAPIYIFTHSETIIEYAIGKTVLDELDIIWLYEVGGIQKQYTFTTEDIKDILNEDITIWLNMNRYLPKEDLPKFD